MKKLAYVFGLLIALPVVADYSPASPREDLFDTPQRIIGGDVSGWMKRLGRPDDFNIEKGSPNPHSGEPVILVTLIYPDVEATFWVNAARGDSILLSMETSSPSFLESLDLPFSVSDRSSWTVLGEPLVDDGSIVRYRDCGDHLCSHVVIRTSEESFASLTWSWDVD